MMSEEEIYKIILQIKNRDLNSMDEFLEEMKITKAISQEMQKRLEDK